MILNVRGTSGSGKTTLVRAVMELYKGSRLRLKKAGRKQPLGYILSRGPDQAKGRQLFIPGHYEVACGGCDTLSGYDESYPMIAEAHDQGMDVLYEGLLISGESARPINLHNSGYPIKVVALNTELQTCIASVNQRRWAKSPDKPPVKERNTIAKARAVEIAMDKMEAAGMDTRWLDRDQALKFMREELSI